MQILIVPKIQCIFPWLFWAEKAMANFGLSEEKPYWELIIWNLDIGNLKIYTAWLHTENTVLTYISQASYDSMLSEWLDLFLFFFQPINIKQIYWTIQSKLRL